MLEKILELYGRRNFKEIKRLLSECNEADIAELLQELSDQQDEPALLIALFRMLPKENAAEVFAYLDKDLQQLIVETITEKEIYEIVNSLFLDDTIDFIEEMPANVVKKVLRHTEAGRRELINKFLKFPEDCAGSIMTIEFVEFHPNITVGDALTKIRKTGINKETVYYCYVISADRRLMGLVELKSLLIEDDSKTVGDIMETNPIYVNTLDDQEHVANVFRKYGFYSMPVVDQEQRLVGIITADDVMTVMEEEATEDIEVMAAVSPSEKPYLKTGVFTLAKHRIIWLLVLMLSATFTANIISGFEQLLSSMIVLSSFIPLLMDTGGNAGSQSSTLVIRGMALDEIHPSDILRVIWKEVRVALIAGTSLSVFNFLRIMLLNFLSHYMSFEAVDPMVAVVVSISMLFTVVIAKVIGCILPIVAKKLKFDPAIMAAPLITTIVDSLALLVYFATASLLLHI